MKQKSKILQLQNDSEALTYLRASHHCLRKEKSVKYLIIVLSFAICLAAIFNRYLPQMAPNVKNIVEIQSIVATVLNLVSGVIVVVGLVLGFYVSRMHTEGTVLRDKYEAYVFDNPNPSILKPIPQTIIEVYAKKTRHKPDKYFKNYLYSQDDDPKDATAQFEYIDKEIRSDYKLYLSIQPFFLTIWIGFCVIVFLIALSFNDTFITTLINILIPSLSAITIIGNSWYGCRLQMKQLQNLINVTNQIKNMSENKRLLYVSDERNMRMLADGLFNYRSSAFVIPTFLEKRYTKSASLENKAHSKLKTNDVENQAGDEIITQKKTVQKKTKPAGEKSAKVANKKEVKPAKVATVKKSAVADKKPTVTKKPAEKPANKTTKKKTK